MADLPSPAEIRKAKKAELAAWCEQFGLDASGKVDDLRKRLLLLHVEGPAKPAARVAKPAPAAAKAPPPKAEEAAEPAEEEPAEEAEEKEEKPRPKARKERKPAFTAKPKAQLAPELRALLRVRAEIASRRPRFLRQEWYWHPRLGMKWRVPTGNQTKLRRHYGYRINVVSIGFRGPKAVRGLHPSGFREVLVHTVRELEAMDPKLEAARIAGSVGGRRRTEIEAAADERGIRVLNRRQEE